MFLVYVLYWISMRALYVSVHTYISMLLLEGNRLTNYTLFRYRIKKITAIQFDHLLIKSAHIVYNTQYTTY